MKILYVTTISGTMNFFRSFVKKLYLDGHTVDIATNESAAPVNELYHELGSKVYGITTSRSPFNKGNLKAIKEIKKIVKENGYDIVHCHTPIAAFVTRLACKGLRKKMGLKVIYTAHGFHFFNGAPKKNWLIYYPIEWLSSFWTDLLITINREDFARVKKHFHAKETTYVPGVGIDIDYFKSATANRTDKRKEIEVPNDAFMVLSVGEINENKNQKVIINAISKLNSPNIHYVLCGGGNSEKLETLAKEKGVNIHPLGHRRDVNGLYKVADMFVQPSYREGLPVAVMEALAGGLPVVASNTRGCSDIIKPEYLFDPDDSTHLAEIIKGRLSDNTESTNLMSIETFDKDSINEEMEALYKKVLTN